MAELLNIGGKRSCLRAKAAHFPGHLPAFKDKYEILGILLAISIALVIIAGAAHGARGKKQTRTIPRRASRVARRNVRIAR